MNKNVCESVNPGQRDTLKYKSIENEKSLRIKKSIMWYSFTRPDFVQKLHDKTFYITSKTNVICLMLKKQIT